MPKRPSAPVIEQSPAEKFFGLVARPFSLTPDLRFVYHSRSHTHALEQVSAALRRREGLIVVTGSIGTGKTMLCRTLLEGLDARTFLSLVLDPGLDVDDLLRKLLSDFGVIKETDARTSGPMSEATRHQYVTALQQFLASLIPLQAHAVVMIDEAQHLNPRVLEELRLLSNFETDQAKLLQIVLVGQPDLDDLLQRPEMRQLNQRVARRCELHPLSSVEVADYIERRLTVATAPEPANPDETPSSSTSVQFTPDGAETVAVISGGIPRIVNTLSDRALDVAYERQERAIDPAIVIDAAERLRLVIPGGLQIRRRRTLLVAAAAAVVMLLAGLSWWWMGARTAPVSPAALPKAATAPSAASAPPDAPPAAVESGVPADAGSQAASAAQAPASSAAPGSTPNAPDSLGPAAAPATQPPPLPPGSFTIAVAAFRTEQRAQSVATAVTELPLPAAVRLDSTGGWYRVVAGPFATRDEADAARELLERRGYAGTRVSQVSAP